MLGIPTLMGIPSDLQNKCRSYLPLKDMHITRSVCKAWKDINDIPKSVVWKSLIRKELDDDSDYLTDPEALPPLMIPALPIPPEAICKNIVKLIYEEVSEARYLAEFQVHPDDAQALNRILNESHSTLEYISIKGRVSNSVSIPQFENVSYLSIELFQTGKSLELLENMPNVKDLVINHVEAEIRLDMSTFPRMKYIGLRHERYFSNLQNFQDSGIKAVGFKLGLINGPFSFTHLPSLLSMKPDVIVLFVCAVKAHRTFPRDARFEFTIDGNNLKISYFNFKTHHSSTLDCVAANLKLLLQKLQEIRPSEITFEGIPLKEAHLLRYILALTELYTESEITAM